MSSTMKYVFLPLVALVLIPFVVSDSYAFKLTDYEIKLEVQFFNDENVQTEQLIDSIDNGLMENIIFEQMEPIAVGQWAINDIIADNSISSSNIPTFHENVMLLDSSLTTIKTNTKITTNPIITEINTSQGANKATIQNQIVFDTQHALRNMLLGFGIKEYLWELQYDSGVVTFAEKLP